LQEEPSPFCLQQDFFTSAADASPVLALQQDFAVLEPWQDFAVPAHCFFSPELEAVMAVGVFFSAAI
jgi:hypothetical protein